MRSQRWFPSTQLVPAVRQRGERLVLTASLNPFALSHAPPTPEQQADFQQNLCRHAGFSLHARALGDIARAKGMTQVAKDAGLSRESLYRALSADGNPSFATVLKVARALGVKLHAEAA